MRAERGVHLLVEFMNPEKNIMGSILKNIRYLLFINFDLITSSLTLMLAYEIA